MPVPANVSLVDAAALPEVTCTVWSMLFGPLTGRLQPGERLLVHGGSSGIGTMAIQLAHQRGAIVFATAGTAAQGRGLPFDLGADVAINYRDEVFDDRVLDETGGAGVDVILDNMGALYLPRNVRSLAIGGRLVVLGLQGGRKGELDLGTLLAKRASVHAAGLRGRVPRTEGGHRRRDRARRVAADRVRRGAAGDRPGARPGRRGRGAPAGRVQRAHRQGAAARVGPTRLVWWLRLG